MLRCWFLEMVIVCLRFSQVGVVGGKMTGVGWGMWGIGVRPVRGGIFGFDV